MLSHFFKNEIKQSIAEASKYRLLKTVSFLKHRPTLFDKFPIDQYKIDENLHFIETNALVIPGSKGLKQFCDRGLNPRIKSLALYRNKSPIKWNKHTRYLLHTFVTH